MGKLTSQLTAKWQKVIDGSCQQCFKSDYYQSRKKWRLWKGGLCTHWLMNKWVKGGWTMGKFHIRSAWIDKTNIRFSWQISNWIFTSFIIAKILCNYHNDIDQQLIAMAIWQLHTCQNPMSTMKFLQTRWHHQQHSLVIAFWYAAWVICGKHAYI